MWYEVEKYCAAFGDLFDDVAELVERVSEFLQCFGYYTICFCLDHQQTYISQPCFSCVCASINVCSCLSLLTCLFRSYYYSQLTIHSTTTRTTRHSSEHWKQPSKRDWFTKFKGHILFKGMHNGGGIDIVDIIEN